jgi:DNA-binding MarR family transcriptional regulator
MSRNKREGPDTPLARQVTAGIFKLGLALRTHVRRDTAPRGLNPTQAQILALLRASEEPLSLSEVAQGMAVTAPTASDAVKALVAKGLVAKTRAADARVLSLALTKAGERAADKGARGPEFVLAAVDALTAEEQAAFMRALVKMIRTLQERGDIVPARMCVYCRFFRPYAHPDDPEQPHHCAFVDAPFGDRALRVDCPEYEDADPARAAGNYEEFVAAPGGTGSPDATPDGR